MTDPHPNFRDLAAAFSAVATEMSRAWTAFARSMSEFWGSPTGQYLKALVDYYEQHPEELDAVIVAREAEARIRYCDCMCSRWGHRGACTTLAVTDRQFALGREPVTVPLCEPCAVSIDRRRPTAAGAHS